MSKIDTSAEAVERLANYLEDPEDSDPPDTHRAWPDQWQVPELAAATLRALAAERDAARDEAYDLRLTIMGGEDAPGFAGSLPLNEIKDLHLRNTQAQQWRAEKAEAKREALREALEEIRKVRGGTHTNPRDMVETMRGIANVALAQKEPGA